MKSKTKWALKAFSMSMVLLMVFAAPAAGMVAFAAGSADTVAPTKPAGLAASSVSQTTLQLSWKASTDDVGVASYAIYSNGKYLASCKATHGIIRAAKPGAKYTFTVAAKDKSGNISAKSNAVTVKMKAATAATTKTAAAPSAKVIAGYYAGWSAYSGYTPSDIQAGNLTHILYAFANIDSSFKIAIGDSQVDPGNLAELKALKKKYPKLKTLISVGGWTWSDKFSDMASTSARRAAFADSVAAFLKKYGLDGVDLDWEYPVGGGESGNSARPADKTNFTLLLQALRSRLDAQGSADGKKYLLTIAGGTGIYDTYSGMKTVSYDQITKTYLSNKAYKRYYGFTGKTPWLFNGSNFITYEDSKSLATKAAYIKSKGIAGAGIWDLGENTNGTFLKALYKGLK
jgi:chitinase